MGHYYLKPTHRVWFVSFLPDMRIWNWRASRFSLDYTGQLRLCWERHPQLFPRYMLFFLWDQYSGFDDHLSLPKAHLPLSCEPTRDGMLGTPRRDVSFPHFTSETCAWRNKKRPSHLCSLFITHYTGIWLQNPNSYSCLLSIWGRTHWPASADNIGIHITFPGDFHPPSPSPLAVLPEEKKKRVE